MKMGRANYIMDMDDAKMRQQIALSSLSGLSAFQPVTFYFIF